MRLRNLVGCLSHTFIKILRDVYHEVTHLFKFVHNIHVINACLIVLAAGFDILNLFIAQEIALIVDVILCCICIGNILQRTFVCSVKFP